MPVPFRETTREDEIIGSGRVSQGLMRIEKEVPTTAVILDKGVSGRDTYRLLGAGSVSRVLTAVDIIRGDEDFRVALYFQDPA